LTSYNPEFLGETITAKTDFHDRTVRKGEPGQDLEEGQPGRDQNGTAWKGCRTGLTGKDSRKDRADKKGQRAMKSRDRTSSAEHPGDRLAGQGRLDRIARV
jgi:hypothetical protein